MIDNAAEKAQFAAEMTLSQNALTLFTTIKNYMAHRNLTSIWAYDNQISRSTRLTLPKLHFAQSELSRSGLMILTPGTAQTRYELPDETEAEQI
jgi:hypothetical protein